MTMTKKHERNIPPHLLRRALDLLSIRGGTEDPQQVFIDTLDNYRFVDELHRKTRLPHEDCVFIINLRDIATACQCKTKN